MNTIAHPHRKLALTLSALLAAVALGACSKPEPPAGEMPPPAADTAPADTTTPPADTTTPPADTTTPLYAGDSATIRISANYLFGPPMAGATVGVTAHANDACSGEWP